MCMYGIVSSDSLVARYTDEGDIEGLQLLFSLGKASPHTICMVSGPKGGHFSRTLLRVGKCFSYEYIRRLMGTDRGRGRKLRTLRILDQSRC
jgi:hypothetical protein